MSAFGSPPLPATVGLSMSDAVADIYGATGGRGDGFVGVETMALIHSEIPCALQEMSSGEQQKYGSVVGETMYELYLPVVSSSGTDILVIGSKASWQFQIDGVRYEAVSEGIKQAGGMQKVAVKRVGTV